MSVEIVEVPDQEITGINQKDGTVEPGRRRGRTKKCRACGMSTYQKEGLCVLCKTGLNEACETLLRG